MAETLQELLPQEAQSDEGLNRFTGNDLSEQVTKLYNQHKELESKFGSIQEEHKKELEGTVKLPGEDADENTKRDFFTKIGCPEKPEEYPNIELEGIPEGFEQDDETVNEIKQACHKAGIPSEQYKAVMEHITKSQMVKLDTFVKQDEAAKEESVKTLTDKWGGEDGFKKGVALGKRLVEKYDPEGEVKEFLNDTRLGNYAPLVELLGNIAKDVLSEEETVTGAPSGESKKGEVERSKITGEPMLRYDQSPGLQNE